MTNIYHAAEPLGLALGLAVSLLFVLSGWALVRDAHNRADAAEQVNRNLRRTDERRSLNVPKGLNVGHLNALIWQARTPDVLDADSAKLLATMIDHAIAGLNPDTLFVIRRERFSTTFGPFEGRRGRYRARLSWTDASAEALRLCQMGIAEPVSDKPGYFRWTPLGLAVIGKLGPELRWWRLGP